MKYIGVIGANSCSAEIVRLAEEVGKEIARRGGILVCGGRGGVMDAAARGASAAGGLVVGILPGSDRKEGSPHLSVALATGLGNARNAVIASASDVLIAIDGGFGTLSEIGLALKMGKRVIGLHTWKLNTVAGASIPITEATSPAAAVDLAYKA